MRTRWNIGNLLDLEYFLHISAEQDTSSNQKENNTRDRAIFRNNIQPHIAKSGPSSRSFIIRAWLDQRKKEERISRGTETILPGEAFEEAFRILKYGLFIFGSMVGIGLAFSLLSYTGTAPLNISVYLGATVFIQILLLLLLGVLFLVRLIQPGLLYTSVFYSLYSRIVISLSRKLTHRIKSSVSGSRREGYSAILGLIKGKKQVYGSLFYWPVFNSMQLFGIGFNLGILVTTLIKVLGTDLAFGWQSTLQVGADAVYKIVKTMAVPWSWFVPPEIAYPTLEQIKGSHLILKDGIYHLTTPDLVAWWPFLCFSVLFYGLLPRLIIYFGGLLKQKHLLSNIKLNHADCDQLMDRMTTPAVHVGGPDESKSKITGESSREETASLLADQHMDKKFVVLISNDIYDSVSNESLQRIFSQNLGGQVVKTIKIESTDKLDDFTQPQLKLNKDWTHLIILSEAWQPPLVEDISFFKSLRNHLGDRIPILIVLIGKPQADNIFTPVKTINWQTWKNKINSIGDPYLRTEKLVHE